MEEISRRISRLQKKLQEQGIDGFLLTQNVDIYYFTGTMQSGYVFVPAEGEPVFFVQRSMPRAREECRVCQVEELGPLRQFGERLAETYPELFRRDEPVKMASEFDVLPVQLFTRLQKALPGAQWTDGSLMIRELRMIKSPFEIAKIREAARIADIAFERAVSQLRPGMKEIEFVALIEHELRLQGHLGIMRMRGYNQELITGMVASGAAAAQPTYFDGPAGGEGLSPASPQGSGWKKIERNEPILVDIGCCADGYVIDQTRTVVIGSLPEDLFRAYRLSEEIQRESEKLLKPGTVCEDIYEQALIMVNKEGLADHFMGYGKDRVKFLGHGIGLEIDEYPVLARKFQYPLQPGMVIAVEPKFTFPGRGVVGIENTYAITETGCERLTVTRSELIQLQ